MVIEELPHIQNDAAVSLFWSIIAFLSLEPYLKIGSIFASLYYTSLVFVESLVTTRVREIPGHVNHVSPATMSRVSRPS